MAVALDTLIQLQGIDIDIDALADGLKSIPDQKAQVQRRIDSGKKALDDAKAESRQLLLKKKEKEGEVAQKEADIRKHQAELNQVKSNEAYKALLGEIEHAKQAISAAEDELLQLMDAIEAAARVFKGREKEWADSEGSLRAEIQAIDQKAVQMQAQIVEKQQSRVQVIESVAKPMADNYERIRKAKKGLAIVPIHRRICGGCHMGISPNLINSVKRKSEVVVCEHCSRILYLPVEAPASTSSTL